MQFLLDRGIGLVAFGSDWAIDVTKIKVSYSLYKLYFNTYTIILCIS
jgi:hypothetical protein